MTPRFPPLAPALPASRRHGLRVLLVDDDEAHRVLFESLIRSADRDSDVTTVGTGSEFLERVRSAEFDIALLDYHLPDGDACELLGRLDGQADRTPILVISADAHTDTILSALRSGGRDFVTKDEALRSGRLIERMRAVVQQQRAERLGLERVKDECVAGLAAGLAYDFNNVLVGVLGKAELLRDGSLPARQRGRFCDDIINAGERLADLSRQLLACARGGRYRPERLSANAALDEALGQLNGAAQTDVRVQRLLAADLWSVEADRAQLVQALLNLCRNALEAMPAGGTLSLYTENATHTESWTDLFDEGHPPGDYVQIVVADTGEGIAAPLRTSIFAPFVSTRGEGRGLGLPAVKGIVATHGGGLLLSSADQGGTAFHVLLPRATPRPPQPDDRG